MRDYVVPFIIHIERFTVINTVAGHGSHLFGNDGKVDGSAGLVTSGGLDLFQTIAFALKQSPLGGIFCPDRSLAIAVGGKGNNTIVRTFHRVVVAAVNFLIQLERSAWQIFRLFGVLLYQRKSVGGGSADVGLVQVQIIAGLGNCKAAAGAYRVFVADGSLFAVKLHLIGDRRLTPIRNSKSHGGVIVRECAGGRIAATIRFQRDLHRIRQNHTASGGGCDLERISHGDGIAAVQLKLIRVDDDLKRSRIIVGLVGILRPPFGNGGHGVGGVCGALGQLFPCGRVFNADLMLGVVHRLLLQLGPSSVVFYCQIVANGIVVVIGTRPLLFSQVGQGNIGTVFGRGHSDFCIFGVRPVSGVGSIPTIVARTGMNRLPMVAGIYIHFIQGSIKRFMNCESVLMHTLQQEVEAEQMASRAVLFISIAGITGDFLGQRGFHKLVRIAGCARDIFILGCYCISVAYIAGPALAGGRLVSQGKFAARTSRINRQRRIRKGQVDMTLGTGSFITLIS